MYSCRAGCREEAEGNNNSDPVIRNVEIVPWESHLSLRLQLVRRFRSILPSLHNNNSHDFCSEFIFPISHRFVLKACYPQPALDFSAYTFGAVYFWTTFRSFRLRRCRQPCSFDLGTICDRADCKLLYPLLRVSSELISRHEGNGAMTSTRDYSKKESSSSAR